MLMTGSDLGFLAAHDDLMFRRKMAATNFPDGIRREDEVCIYSWATQEHNCKK